MCRQRALVSRLHHHLPASTVQQRLPGRSRRCRHRLSTAAAVQLAHRAGNTGVPQLARPKTNLLAPSLFPVAKPHALWHWQCVLICGFAIHTSSLGNDFVDKFARLPFTSNQ